ncbi:hypothetical protein DEU56DRAFT_347158 [Suillus clintonianus]|uniref:uncharacterized protein n=1 Tax=Suillus clintonianus TaxID=1904413 RepID=UPI001B885BC6|nr:uncharacterized protein DEU56DRAFT_347158 [Suillus clintonianus]KAG2138025.1 hypothetical protein DEU56DRAFT_347158 [Suillus clintonianus]
MATIETILTELLTRVKYRGEGQTDFALLYAVLSLLSYICKAPLVKPGTDIVNSLGRQRNALESFLKACFGLQGNSDLLLEFDTDLALKDHLRLRYHHPIVCSSVWKDPVLCAMSIASCYHVGQVKTRD